MGIPKLEVVLDGVDAYKADMKIYSRLKPEESKRKFRELSIFRRGYFNACLRNEDGLRAFYDYYENFLEVCKRRAADTKIKRSKAKYLDLVRRINTNLKTLGLIFLRNDKIRYGISRRKTSRAKERGREKIKGHVRRGGNLVYELIGVINNLVIPGFDERGIFDSIREAYEDLGGEKNRIIQRRYKRYQELSHELTNCNLPLVISIARGFSYYDLELRLELIQEGNIGLMRAVEKYNSDIAKFSTYATKWILQKIFAALKEKTRTVKINRTAQEENSKLKKTRSKLSHELDREPFVDEIAEEAGMDISKVRFLEKILKRRTISFDRPMKSGDNVYEIIGGDVKEVLGFYSEVEDAMNRLPERLRMVVEMRYGLNGYTEHTLDKVGGKLGVTRERIRQIQNQAEERLALYLAGSPFRGKFLKQDFLV